MGASFSAHLMQTVTWLLTLPLASSGRSTQVHTCIDNVCFFGNDPADFVKAVRDFLSSCAELGIQLNPEGDVSSLNDREILEAAAASAKSPFIFLGEEFVGNSVRNSEKKHG